MTMRPTKSIVILLLILSALAWPVPAAAQESIGIVRTSSGTATINRGGQILPAAVGTKLLAADTLTTGSDGSIGVILRDNSTLSIGPESNLIIQEFLFSPAAACWSTSWWAITPAARSSISKIISSPAARRRRS